MAKVLISYYSKGGNTRKMADMLAKGLEAQGVEVVLKKVAETTPADMAAADGILLGSPCYFGNMATPMKELVDQSIQVFGKGELVGKPAGAFVSTGGIGGCGEVALMSLVTAMMIHGMVAMGSRKGGHLGPLAIGEPDERVVNECQMYAELFANLVKKLAA